MAPAIAAPGIPLDQIDPSQLVTPTEATTGVALEDVNPADLTVPGVPLDQVDPGQLATEDEYLAKLTPGQLVERKARALFENRPVHETSKYDAPAVKRYLESNSLFSKDLRTPEEKIADGETPEPLPNLPFGLEKVLPEGLTKFAVNATAGTFTLMNEAAKKVLRADLMATRFTSEEEKKAFAAAGQKAPALKFFPIPDTEKPGAAITAATLGNTARGAALVMEGAEDIAHLMFGRDQAQAAQKLAGKGVDDPHARKAQERFDTQVALRLAAMRAEAGTPVAVNPQGQIEFGQAVPAPADRPDPATVASIQQSPIADPTNFIPMGTGFAATRKPLLAGATLAAKEAPGALPTAMAKVTDAAAKGLHAAERAIDTSPIAQGLMAAATTAAVGGDAPQAALAALLGANVKNLGLAHRTIGRAADSLDRTTGKLLGQIPPGPIGRFAASTYKTLAPEARTLALGQVYNMPFLLGADTEEEFTGMVMAGAFAHAAGSAAGRTLNGLNIAKNFFDAGDRAPEIRLPVKDVGVDPFLDAAHQELVSGLNNASNNFVESVRQAVGKGGGEAYVVSLDAYHKYLDGLVGKEVIGRDGTPRVWTADDAALAKNQQGMSFQTRAEDGSVRKIQLTPVRDVQPGLSVGHEATHFLERALLSDDERAYLQRETLRYYGEADAHNYFVRHMDLLEPGRDRAGDPASWADMTPEQREFTLSEIIAEHGNAAFNALPIGKLGFDTGAQSYARTMYGMLGRMLERMGVKRPELSPEGYDPTSKPTTGLGIEPSMRLSTLIENLIQAKMLDGELPASAGAKPAPGIDVAPRETQDAPKNVRPVEPKTTKPGFKKGDPIGELRNENGRLIGRDAVVQKDLGDGTYDVEYNDTTTGGRVVGTIPGKWLESEINPNAPRPEKPVFPTSPITSESPVGAAVAPTLPVPKAVENTTRPEGSAETSAKTSANPNVRTTPEKQQALAGPADPQVIQKNKALLQEIEKQPRSARGPVETDYYSAKSPVSSPNQVVREKQRLAADAAEQDGQPNPLRTRYQKIFVPYKVVENKNGTTSVFGMSLDKVAQNLDLLRGWLKTNPEAALVVDQAYLSGPEIAADLKKYLANQANGYAGDGRKLTRPADARDITPETPGYVPDLLPPDRAQVLNLLMGMEQPKTESPGQAFARRFAEANGITVGTIDGVSETNALRARLREKGFDPSILNAVVENLRVDRITTPLKPRPDLSFPAGDTGIQRAGFMPQTARRPQGNDETRTVVRRYLERTGIKAEPHERYASIDESRMKRIADWFEQAKHEPENPEVQKAYRALADETKAQYQEMLDAGIAIEPFEGKGEPYASSADMMRDVRENKHLFFLSTDKAFGEGADAGANPLLEPSGIRAGGRELLMNDLFRAVHDYFGHTAEGFEFGPRGEYNAYLAHSRMFSDAAKPALAAETLAQNSWVNFGPHLRRADGSLPRPGEEGYVAPKDRRFADQKTTIVPPELLREADAGADFMPQFKLGKTKVEYGDEYTPVLKGAKVVGRIEPDFANEGFRAMTVERDDLGTAPSPKEALKLFTVDNIKPAKKEIAPVEKPKKGTAPAPTGWLLPDGEYAGQNDRTGVYQNTGDWHGEHILQNADDYKSRFGLKRGRNEDLRLAALRSGFVRLRYDGASGRMGIEANAKHFKKQLPKLEDILEQNLGKIDRLDVNLFDDQGNVVRANGEAVFKLDDFAKSQAVLDILRGRPIREVDFMPSASPDERVAYHGTFRNIRNFKLGDLGVHFSSSPEGANRRIEDASSERKNPEMKGARVFKVGLTLKNPVRLPDVGNWKNAFAIARELQRLPEFSERDLEAELRRFEYAEGRVEQLPYLRDQLKKAGYDGVVYQNQYEGGGDSFIAFDPGQVNFKSIRGAGADFMPAFGIEKPVREEFQRIFERVKATDNDGATFNPDGTVADTSALPVIVTLGALTQDAATASALRAANFFNRHEEFLATPNARPGLFHFGDKLSADLNVALPLDRLDLAKKFAADNNQDSIYNAAAGEVVKTGGSGVPRLSSPLEYAVAAKLLSEGTYTTIDKVKQIAAGLEGTEVGSIPNLDLRTKIKDAVAEAEAENDGKPLSKVRVNRIAREIETEVRSRMVDVPVISLTPAKGKKTVLNPDTPEKWDEVNRRADDALRVTALDPELGLGEFGYRRAFAESGLSTDVPPAPEQFARYVREPALFAKMLRDAQEKNPQLIESALGGLAHVRKMHELARAGKLEPETVALHMAWGIASRMLAPFDQEGGWIRVVRSPEVLEAMASSINGTFSLSKDQWKATVQKAMTESNARTDDPAAYAVGRNAIANLNAFHLMLSQWNGHWRELTDIFNNPSLTGPQMRDAFFRQGFGGAGIKHKVVSFDILTLARDDVFVGDRWQVIHGNLPLLERIAKERGYDSPFNYDKNGTPQDRVGIYGAYGPLIDSPSVGQVYYKLIERGLAAVGASPEVSAVFGRPLSASDVHWLSWNIIKNEPVGHSSLEVTYDLLTSGTTLNRVGSKALANELATRPIRTQRFNPETKGFDEFTVENNRAVLRRAVNR